MNSFCHADGLFDSTRVSSEWRVEGERTVGGRGGGGSASSGPEAWWGCGEGEDEGIAGAGSVVSDFAPLELGEALVEVESLSTSRTY